MLLSSRLSEYLRWSDKLLTDNLDTCPDLELLHCNTVRGLYYAAAHACQEFIQDADPSYDLKSDERNSWHALVGTWFSRNKSNNRSRQQIYREIGAALKDLKGYRVDADYRCEPEDPEISFEDWAQEAIKLSHQIDKLLQQAKSK